MTIDEIQSEILDYCDATTTSYPLADRIRRVNMGQGRAVSLILSADGRWQWDDTNHSNLPIGTTNLVANQQDYTFDDTFLNILRVEIKNENGDWIKLKGIDKTEVGVAMDEFYSTAGTPLYYDKLARSVFLYPKPSYNSTNGLKVYFQRAAHDFETTDTTEGGGAGTQEPGFASLFHDILALYASKPYVRKYKKDVLAETIREIEAKEKELVSFYGKRSKDEVRRFIPRRKSAI